MYSKIGLIGIFGLCILVSAIFTSAVTAKDDEIENLLTNPDFEAGTAGWSIGAEGALSIDDKESPPGTDFLSLLATINAAGAEDWNPETHSPAFDV